MKSSFLIWVERRRIDLADVGHWLRQLVLNARLNEQAQGRAGRVEGPDDEPDAVDSLEAQGVRCQIRPDPHRQEEHQLGEHRDDGHDREHDDRGHRGREDDQELHEHDGEHDQRDRDENGREEDRDGLDDERQDFLEERDCPVGEVVQQILDEVEGLARVVPPAVIGAIEGRHDATHRGMRGRVEPRNGRRVVRVRGSARLLGMVRGSSRRRVRLPPLLDRGRVVGVHRRDAQLLLRVVELVLRLVKLGPRGGLLPNRGIGIGVEPMKLDRVVLERRPGALVTPVSRDERGLGLAAAIARGLESHPRAFGERRRDVVRRLLERLFGYQVLPHGLVERGGVARWGAQRAHRAPPPCAAGPCMATRACWVASLIWDAMSPSRSDMVLLMASKVSASVVTSSMSR